MQKSASIRPRASFSRFGGDSIHLFIRLLDEVLNEISWNCLRVVLEQAISKIPVETELQKKVKLKEREEFEEAVENRRATALRRASKDGRDKVDMAKRFLEMGIEPLVVRAFVPDCRGERPQAYAQSC